MRRRHVCITLTSGWYSLVDVCAGPRSQPPRSDDGIDVVFGVCVVMAIDKGVGVLFGVDAAIIQKQKGRRRAPRSRGARAGVVDVCIGVDVVRRVGMGVGIVTGVGAGIMNKK